MAATVLVSCGGDDDNPTPVPAAQSFSYDNHDYQLIAAQGLVEIKMQDVLTIDGQSYDRSTLTLIGMNGFVENATVAFDLYYKHGMSVAGTYNIDDSIDDSAAFETYLATQDRACMGWTSQGTVFNLGGGDPLSGNNPSGTVTVTANSAANYTIAYHDNFKLYDDGFTFVRNIPCSIDVTGEVYQQQAP